MFNDSHEPNRLPAAWILLSSFWLLRALGLSLAILCLLLAPAVITPDERTSVQLLSGQLHSPPLPPYLPEYALGASFLLQQAVLSLYVPNIQETHHTVHHMQGGFNTSFSLCRLN